MATSIDKEEELTNKIKTAVKFEEQLNSPLSEVDKAEINEITSGLKDFLKKNEKFKVKESFLSKFIIPSFNLQVLGSAAASLVIGIFVGQQFLSESIKINETEFLTKSISFIEQEKLISLQDKLEPGKKLAFDINSNLLIILKMSELPINEENNCHKVELQINGLTKSNSLPLTACPKYSDGKKSWVLTDIQ